MRVSIYTDNDDRGYVNYNPFTREVIVQHPNQNIRKRVYRYLSSKQDIGISKGNEIGSVGITTVNPLDNSTTLQIVLCTMYNKISVHVDWSDALYDKDNSLDNEEVVKSEEYEIVDL